MGTLASTATFFPPGRWTTMSGRILPLSASDVTCSSKSQCSSMPAISTTRRSCSSPHLPRVWGDRRRGDQVAGLLLQVVVGDRQRPHLLGEGGVGLLALDLESLHPLLVLAELIADGLQQLLDGHLPLGQLPFGGLPRLVQLGVGQLEELLVVLLEGQGRESGELSRQLLSRLLEGLRPFGGGLPLVLELGGQAGHLPLQGQGQPMLLGQLVTDQLDLGGQGLVATGHVGQTGLRSPRRRHVVGAQEQSHHHPQGGACNESDDESGDHDQSSSGP